jgi:hypothetical protein
MVDYALIVDLNDLNITPGLPENKYFLSLSWRKTNASSSEVVDHTRSLLLGRFAGVTSIFVKFLAFQFYDS